jgi:hypothetical protein
MNLLKKNRDESSENFRHLWVSDVRSALLQGNLDGDGDDGSNHRDFCFNQRTDDLEINPSHDQEEVLSISDRGKENRSYINLNDKSIRMSPRLQRVSQIIRSPYSIDGSIDWPMLSPFERYSDKTRDLIGKTSHYTTINDDTHEPQTSQKKANITMRLSTDTSE